jgi:NitT/TauT family transport system substrate-binding protein
MKKFTILLSAILISITMLLTGCGSESKVIKLNEVTHSIFYAPLYVAINNGYFKDNDIEIELTNGGGTDKSMAALLSGEADIALMGPEGTIYTVVGKSNDHPIVFGQLTKRDGSFLVGRSAEPNFEWQNLKGKTIIGGRKGGVPEMTLEYVLKNKGLKIGSSFSSDVDTVVDTSIAFNLTASAFEGGTGDYCTLFEPVASAVVKEKKGYIIASVGQESGEVPYTAFTAKKSYLKDHSDKLKKFLTCIMKGYYFLMNESDENIYNALSPSFAGTTKEDIISAINSYKKIDAWNNTPVMQANAFDRLQNIMIEAKELSNKVNFTDVVDNSLAFEVMQQLNS